MDIKSIALKHRRPEHPVDPLFPGRWSPRAMSGEELSHQELMTLFEAARWAPSSSNYQPWRFLYARRNTPPWPLFFDLLVEGNKRWTQNAAALVVVASLQVSEKNNRPNRTHSYDTGAAWMSLALQGALRNLVVHGMAGFDYAAAKERLRLPDTWQVEAMAAIGKPAEKTILPPELEEREIPSGRKSVSDFIFEGPFTPGGNI